MKVLIKGGVWKNTEDEILKAAVMKYGKNQWARISSLLVRKTPKQCKARWYEWLDPSIKKTEWSVEEDEKLLHLAKLMPTQWRTIAPIVGRTPAQCLERYQHLLDEAEAKDAHPDDDVTADDVRKLRPGEIDPDPETKPARPDPVDMDEDEKEMLSEARARLANTQGKKAKRKAREKQMEDSRRLAVLQKKRELKAAGISERKSRKKNKKVAIDYNADIPLQAKAPAGFWNTLEEKELEASQNHDVINEMLQNLEGKRKLKSESDEQQKGAKRQKIQKVSEQIVSQQALQAAKEAEVKKSIRKQLVLPSPQVSENEMAEIIKVGHAGEATKSIVESGEASSSTGGLLNDYSTMGAPSATPMRTPRVDATQDSVMIQARNLKAMSSSQTPLLGGESVELQDDGRTPGFTGGKATPGHGGMKTPNPMASQLRSGETPATAGRTPLRDEMGINTPRHGGSGFDDGLTARKPADQGKSLQGLFASLPKPANDFEIIVPESQPLTNNNENGLGPREEDAADIYARNQSALEAKRNLEYARRTTPVVKDLPRPLQVFKSSYFGSDPVQVEKYKLMLRDARKYTYPGQSIPPMSSLENENGGGEIESINDDDWIDTTEASQLVKQELEKSEVIKDLEVWTELHDKETNQYTFIPSSSSSSSSTTTGPGVFQKKTETNSDEVEVEIQRTNLELIKNEMRLYAQKASKLEKKLNLTCGGYIQKYKTLKKTLLENWKDMNELQGQIQVYTKLYNNMESPGLTDRLFSFTKEVDRLVNLEKEYQNLYMEKQRELTELKSNQ